MASAAEAQAAIGAGADRIEINRALERHGLTPSVAAVGASVSKRSVPVLAMLRPHDRDFVYSDLEFMGVLGDLGELLAAGATGVVFGALTAQHGINCGQMSRLIRAAGTHPVVFHRAFDSVLEPQTALEQLIDLGVTRILTSGQARSAMEGAGVIRALIEQAGERIEILPGAGVNPSNAAELVRLTGCSQIHGSFRGSDGTFDSRLLAQTRVTLNAAPLARS